MKAFNVYENTLTNPTYAKNEGAKTISLFDYSDSRSGRDDHDSRIIGALLLDDEWTIGISIMGLPLVCRYDVSIPVEGEYAESIKSLDRNHVGIRYVSIGLQLPVESIDLADSEEWQKLEHDFLGE